MLGLRWALLGMILVAAAQAQAGEPLFPAAGLSAAAVRQGGLGSCYFHAAVAALAEADPAQLAGHVARISADSYRVHFTDGPDEVVRWDDVAFARSSDFDRSNGLWVAVLFRGYAQRVLRAALAKSVADSSLPAALKPQALAAIAASDVGLAAYDRAIRSVVAQDGTISAARLRAELHYQLQQVPLPDPVRALIESAAVSQSAASTLAAMVAANGEIFGAYRAVGNGGLPVAVFAAFASGGQAYQDLAPAMLALRVADAEFHHRAMVAGTGDRTLAQLRAAGAPAGPDADSWYLPQHAYTLLASTGLSITLRNPWALHPDATQGVFTISIREFQALFPSLFVQQPAA